MDPSHDRIAPCRRPNRRAALLLATSVGTLAGAMSEASGQVGNQSSPIGSSAGQNGNPNPNVGQGTPGFLPGMLGQSTMLGDMLGMRSYLASKGITYGITETSEVLGNATGGVHRGADYDGLTTLSVGLDTARAFGLVGGAFNLSAFEIHGRSVSADNLYTLQTASGIEASDTFRLWELWYDQATRDGRTDLKIGQQSVDQEFITSTYSTLFLNTVMGWPAVPSYDLYAGGPAYPLSSLGVRLRTVRGPVTAQVGAYDDNPPGGPFDADSQLRGAERSGTAFHLGTGVLVLAELQYALGQPVTGQDVHPGDVRPTLPGTYRLGAWYDSGAFPDRRFDGLSLAAPPGDGTLRLQRNNYSVYFSGDQQVWLDRAAVRSVGVFLRVMGAPADRNLLSFSGDTGVTLKAPLLSRPNDSLGFGYGIAKLSPDASALVQVTRSFAQDTSIPVPSSESFVELTYQMQIAPWWMVQPDFQYVWTPGGGISNPLNPDGRATPRIGNEAVFGIRTNITF